MGGVGDKKGKMRWWSSFLWVGGCVYLGHWGASVEFVGSCVFLCLGWCWTFWRIFLFPIFLLGSCAHLGFFSVSTCLFFLNFWGVLWIPLWISDTLPSLSLFGIECFFLLWFFFIWSHGGSFWSDIWHKVGRSLLTPYAVSCGDKLFTWRWLVHLHRSHSYTNRRLLWSYSRL